MMKRLRSKAGMTLIETMIGLVMFTIIATAAAAVMAPMMNAFFNAMDFSEVNTFLDNVSAELLSDLSDAVVNTTTGIAIDTTTGAAVINRGGGMPTVTYSINANGRLVRSTPNLEEPSEPFENIMAERFYRNRRVNVVYDVSDPTAVGVTVIASRVSGDEVGRRTYVVKPLGLFSNGP